MKFIHIADLHLGAVPDGDRQWSEKRKRDLWESFAEVVKRAEEEQADFLFIAGDLFHRQPLKRELKEFASLCSGLTHTKVLLVAGNHDRLEPQSYYRSFNLGENVFLFGKEEITSFDFPELNTTVYGFSYWHKELKENRLLGIKPENGNRINVLLAHGGDADHVPFRIEELKKSGFDYMAFGHIHKPEQLIKDRAVMAGALEPVDHTEYGPHGYWIGEVDKNGCRVNFIPIKKCEYRLCQVPVTEHTTNQKLQQQIQEILIEKEPYQLLRISLQGQKDPAVEFDLAAVQEMEDIVDVRMNELISAYSYEKLKEDYKNTILGRYIDEIQRMPQSRSREKALFHGVDALYRAMERL